MAAEDAKGKQRTKAIQSLSAQRRSKPLLEVQLSVFDRITFLAVALGYSLEIYDTHSALTWHREKYGMKVVHDLQERVYPISTTAV